MWEKHCAELIRSTPSRVVPLSQQLSFIKCAYPPIMKQIIISERNKELRPSVTILHLTKRCPRSASIWNKTVFQFRPL